jgi:hypothetical protein
MIGYRIFRFVLALAPGLGAIVVYLTIRAACAGI